MPGTIGRINILYLINAFNIGGAEKAMVRLISGLNRKRYNITVAALYMDSGLILPELKQAGVEIVDLGMENKLDIKIIGRLYQLIRRGRFQIVVCSLFHATILGRLLARIASVPIVVNWEVNCHFGKWHRRLLNRLTSPLSNKIIADSMAVREALISDLRISEKRIGVILPGLEVEKYETTRSIRASDCIIIGSVGQLYEQKGYPFLIQAALNKFDISRKKQIRRAFRQKWKLAPEEYCVLFIGRLWEQKNPEILAEISASVRHKKPNLRFKILVAGDGPLETPLRKRIRELKVESNFKLLDWVDDNLSVHFGSDVVILPSLWEGLPRTLIEAQASGLPIIVSDIKGNREVVTPETGFICRPKEPENYADAIIELSDLDLRQTMGKAARQRAERLFDSAVNNQKIIECYKRLLNQKGIRI